MKTVALFAAFAFTSLFLLALPTPAMACSQATLNGAYAFTVHGAILAGPAAGVVDGIALTVFDGHGNLQQVDAVAHNGTVATLWRPGTGTYSLNSNCTGTMNIQSPGSPELQLAIVVSRSGRTIHTVVLNTGFAITSDAEKVRADEE